MCLSLGVYLFYIFSLDSTARDSTVRPSVNPRKPTTERPAVLTTGALRSRLSLKYQRVQFGWFGDVQQFTYTYDRSVTYGLSSLFSAALTPSPVPVLLYPTVHFSLCSLPVPYSGVSLLRPLRVVRTPTKLHPLAPSSCPTPSHHRHLLAYEPRARLPNPIPPILILRGSNLRAVFFFSISLSHTIAISLFSFQQ